MRLLIARSVVRAHPEQRVGDIPLCHPFDHRVEVVATDRGSYPRRRLRTLVGSSIGRTPDSGSGGWRFESSPTSSCPSRRCDGDGTAVAPPRSIGVWVTRQPFKLGYRVRVPDGLRGAAFSGMVRCTHQLYRGENTSTLSRSAYRMFCMQRNIPVPHCFQAVRHHKLH